MPGMHNNLRFESCMLTFESSGKGEECIPQTWDMYHEK